VIFRYFKKIHPGENKGEIMKEAKDCINIEEIRNEIDRIDREITGLLAKRAEYVHCAAKFKTSAQGVKAGDRVKSMIEKRKIWAEELNLSPLFIENLFNLITGYFISDEMKKWKETQN